MDGPAIPTRTSGCARPKPGAVRESLPDTAYAAGETGLLTEEWAKRLGLRPNIAVSVGAFDAHMGLWELELRKVLGQDNWDFHLRYCCG